MRKPSKIPTSYRMIKIIEVVGKSGQALTQAEINREINLPKQSLHRLCKRLIQEGYLVKSENNRVAPGDRLKVLARSIFLDSDQKIVRHQILQSAANKIGETINLVIPESKGMIYIDRVETDWPLRIQLPIGSNVPFHCTASGKTYLSKLPAKELRILASNLELTQLTKNTICTSEDLLKELEVVSKQGFALDKEEFIPGMVAAAVPISDMNGKYIASIAFHGPTQRLSLEELLKKKEFLFDSAKQLQEVLI